MADNILPTIASNLVEPVVMDGIHLDVNPEDAVPFRPQAVFISLGLNRETFREQSRSSETNDPPIDLATPEGQLRALLALGFEPGPDLFGSAPLYRAAEKFKKAYPLPPGSRQRLGRANGLINDERVLQVLQLKLRESSISYTLGGIKVPAERRPQLFLVEHYQLSSFRGDLARDDMIGSVSLLPRESVTYKLIVKKKTSQRNELTSSVLDSQDEEATSNFNKQVKDSADAKFGENNYNYGFDANFHGEAGMGFGQVSADAEVHAQGATNEVREEFAQSTSSAIDSQAAQTNRTRHERMVVGTIIVDLNEETESVVEKSSTNPTDVPVNIGIFQVKEEFVSLLNLVDVEIAFRNGDPNQNRIVPLHQLGGLLEAVIEQPEQRESITRCIKSALLGIRDYQNNLKSIVKADTSSSVGFSIDRRLESVYPLKKSDGTLRRNLSVSGVILRDYRRYLRKPMVSVQLPIT